MEEKKFNNFENQQLPNATAVLVLGILSIITCCCYGVGAILGGVALYLSKKDMNLYKENPQSFSNYGNLKTGRILSIIGIVLSAIYLVFIIIFYSMFGMAAASDPQLIQEKLNDLIKQ